MYQILNIAEAQSSNISWPDIYYTPEYGEVVETHDQKWECAVQLSCHESGACKIMCVYLKKPLIFNGKNYYDLCSPYGYAGYYFEDGTTEKDINNFIQWFQDQCLKRSYITELIRFNPYLCDATVLKSHNYNIQRMRSTYSIPITNYDNYFSSSSGNHRNMTRKAIKAELTFHIKKMELTDVKTGSQFRCLYEQTMNARKAQSFYYFDDEYFDKLSKLPGVYLAHIENKQGLVQAMSLFFVYRGMVHYHLSCRGEKMLNGSQNYLFDNLVQWCLNHHLKMIHLGGGLSENDSLSQFKASISSQKHDYYFGKKIVDAEIYQQICQSVATDNKLELTDLLQENYFPVYRKYI